MLHGPSAVRIQEEWIDKLYAVRKAQRTDHGLRRPSYRNGISFDKVTDRRKTIAMMVIFKLLRNIRDGITTPTSTPTVYFEIELEEMRAAF